MKFVKENFDVYKGLEVSENPANSFRRSAKKMLSNTFSRSTKQNTIEFRIVKLANQMKNDKYHIYIPFGGQKLINMRLFFTGAYFLYKFLRFKMYKVYFYGRTA